MSDEEVMEDVQPDIKYGLVTTGLQSRLKICYNIDISVTQTCYGNLLKFETLG